MREMRFREIFLFCREGSDLKVLHLSDLHLGKRLNGFSMLEDQEYILEQILRITYEEQPQAVIIAGDVYDKAVPPAEAVRLLDDFLVRLSETGAAVRDIIRTIKNKNDYPFLAISINNLIPSCSVCNLLKHDNDTSLLYPYEEGIGNLYIFETDDLPGTFTKLREGALRAPEEFDINLTRTVGPGNEAGDRAENSIREFALKKLYQSHKGYITAMYYQRYIHTDEFCEDLVRQFPFLAREKSDPNDDLPLTEEEIRLAKEKLKKALYLMDYSQERWGDRPLAKLTHDIAEEIERRARGIK